MKSVEIIGAGPAGATAAISAGREGVAVRIQEKSRFPRHKVCGEFLSPELLPALDRLGLMAEFQQRRPATIRRMGLCFGAREKWSNLPEAAYGLSRYAFDDLLFRRASAQAPPDGSVHARILATGRSGRAPKGSRLFGFKAHFRGPADDAVELHFFEGCYVGLNAIEGGLTNVCGLAPEHELARLRFCVDELVARSPALRERMSRLTPEFPWLRVGPLVFGQRFDAAEGEYPVGDALSFIDPFTGTGLASAVLTGELAGRAVAAGWTSEQYLRECRRYLHSGFRASSVFRSAVRTRIGQYLGSLLPGQWLFHLTRPARG